MTVLGRDSAPNRHRSYFCAVRIAHLLAQIRQRDIRTEPLYEALLSVFPFPVALGARQANYVAGIFAE